MNTSTIASLRNKERHVGIDVGKSFLDIAIFELNSHWQVDNTPAGIKGLMAVLKRYKLTRVLVEATGGYERAFVEACAEKLLPVIVVQPVQVRQFADAQGIRAKTDKIDARLIALFGKILQPEVRPIASKEVRLIRDLLARKRQLNEARTQELNRQHKAPNRTVLYMAMLCAIQHNPVMRNFYQKLVAQGKHKKVAITACMRKMITILNTMVRNNQEWQTN
jgi:transposase